MLPTVGAVVKHNGIYYRCIKSVAHSTWHPEDYDEISALSNTAMLGDLISRFVGYQKYIILETSPTSLSTIHEISIPPHTCAIVSVVLFYAASSPTEVGIDYGYALDRGTRYSTTLCCNDSDSNGTIQVKGSWQTSGSNHFLLRYCFIPLGTILR